MTRVLGIETSGPRCAAAVLAVRGRPATARAALAGGTVVERSAGDEFARHAERLFPLLASALAAAGTGLTELDGVAVSIGPGSFTGLRVGLTAAKVFARFGRLPLAAIPTLEAMALDVAFVSSGGIIVPRLDARRGELYAAVYGRAGDGVRRAAGPWVVTPDALAARVPPGALAAADPPRAGTIAAAGLVRLLRGRRESPDRLVPVYLRRPAAVEKLRRGLFPGRRGR